MADRPQNYTNDHGRPSRRGRLVGLWVLAIILAVVAFGTYIYQRAKSDVEVYYASTYACRGGIPGVTYQGILFSSEDWVSLEFRLPYPEAEPPSPEFLAESIVNDECWRIAATFEPEVKWSLRQFGPQPLPEPP